MADANGSGPGPEVADRPPPPPPTSAARPGLQRNVSAPPPAVPVPPAPMPPSQAGAHPPTDSLSLVQLRRIVAEFNKPEPIAYDFQYEDLGPFEEEVDEWFVYQFWQWVRLNAAQAAFEAQWELQNGPESWEESSPESKTQFLREVLTNLASPDDSERSEAVRGLLYVALGRWADTATAPSPDEAEDERSVASSSQLEAMKSSIQLLTSQGGLAAIWKATQRAFEVFWSDDSVPLQPANLQDAHDEVLNLMTIMYIAVQQALSDPEAMASTRKALLALNPTVVSYMSFATSKVRWDESNALPLPQMLLLLWKSILLVFGGTAEIDEVKKAVSETDKDEKSNDLITASPLDYHAFRQELTSKYPAYVPPQPLIPLEAENSTILPPPPSLPPKNAANGIIPGPPNSQSGGASILHQPVHIATPAPSPPPSPAVGGKGGKKQNYQTNQNFPFLYPPLDATSNSAGGKGGAGLQHTLVGRKWEGSDIPASILEAGELFATRVRMNRATRQLWDEREKFMKSERGWDEDSLDGDVDGLDLDSGLDPEADLDLDLSELSVEDRELIMGLRGPSKRKKTAWQSEAHPEEANIDLGPHPQANEEVQRRLLAVESFYKEALPHLQSLAIVLLRPTFMNVSAVASQQAQQHQNMAGRGANPGVNGGPGGPGRQQQDPPSAVPPETRELTPEEVDAARSREIMTKAATGAILLLLKWLKLSHVLKYEYLSQLLLDHNYVPLVLKLFAHQDIQNVVDSKTDRIENSFFHFCNVRSNHKEQTKELILPNPTESELIVTDSEDEAAPPPIKRRRSPPRPEPTEANGAEGEGQTQEGQQSTRPEVDELGYPVNPLPMEPITDFSRRNFFSMINYLRIMQKLCKRKAHRNLLLVQYKSSNILRKSLKVPQPLLRLYTLKLFKNQVPYCGRKWRQSNMRVITAVYLHVRPELRDEWLAGSDVDAEVDSALPLEQALRSLTHWFNVRRYPDKIANEVRAAYREEHGFFTRELEKLGFSFEGADDGTNSDWGH
ncbi:hypothetical protein F5X68DRAFT_207789 [Plectosphaerella plurivora]|uniref:Uncharacterized protein n=1 Tax=Plectosphaerella plurivora TaxID=936078 RepID=A0A9P8VAG0_9PEZI|nr:hypothetical protein F5X68DRAFT_207789 [Plectosphaerella plurivora]